MSSIPKLIILVVVGAALLYTAIQAFHAWYDRDDSQQAGQKATRLMGILALQGLVSLIVLSLVQWEPEVNLHNGHSSVSAAVSAAVTLILLRRKKRA